MLNGEAISPARYQTALVRLHKDETTTSQRRVSEEEGVHETATRPWNNLWLQTRAQIPAQDEIKTTTKKISEDNGCKGKLVQ